VIVADHVAPDTSLFTMPVKSDQQSAAIRWRADMAVVDAASGFYRRHGWPDQLHTIGDEPILGNGSLSGFVIASDWRHGRTRLTPWIPKRPGLGGERVAGPWVILQRWRDATTLSVSGRGPLRCGVQ
jgi:hypothetical protein